MKKPTNTRKTLKLSTEKLLPLENVHLDKVVGGIGGATAFPCWTQNNCPGPAM
jgi:hypothetical protein